MTPKSLLPVLGLLLLVICGAFLYGTVGKTADIRSRASTATTQKPITGTFLMYDMYFAKKDDFLPYFRELKDSGITTVVILATDVLDRNPCTGGKFVENPRLGPNDQIVQTALAAKELGMTLVIGTGSSGSCVHHWNGNPADPTTDAGRLIDMTLRDYKLLEDSFRQAGLNFNDSSFVTGFYINEETEITDFLNPGGIAFYTAMSAKLKTAYPAKHQWISPWMLEKTDYAAAKRSFDALLSKTAIDIVAPQDSVGAGHTTTFTRDADHYRALADAVKAYPGRQAWANIETFTDGAGEPSYKPAAIDMVRLQIETAKPYVSGMITWIYQHTMAVDPRLTSVSSWTNNYRPVNAVRRRLLHDRYLDLYGGGKRVDAVFPWNGTLAVKGKNLSANGQAVTLDVTYMAAGTVKSARVTITPRNESDGYTAYIPQTSLPGIDLTAPISVAVIGTAPAVPTVRPTTPLQPTAPPVKPTTPPLPTLKPTSVPTQAAVIQPLQIVPTATPVPVTLSAPQHVFFWYQNLVLKGTGWGTPGTPVTVTLTYAGKTVTARIPLVREEMDVLYIAKTAVPGFDPAKPYTVKLSR